MTVSATFFEILTLKARKSLNFSDRPLFKAPVRGKPLEFGDEIWRQKTRILWLPDDAEIMTLAVGAIAVTRDRENFIQFVAITTSLLTPRLLHEHDVTAAVSL